MAIAHLDSSRGQGASAHVVDNRRQFERRILRSKAFLVLPGRPHILVRTLDISVGGMGIVAPINTSPNLVCEVKFLLPNPAAYSHIQASGLAVVTHSVFASGEDGFKTGLKFKEFPKEILDQIERFIKSSY